MPFLPDPVPSGEVIFHVNVAAPPAIPLLKKTGAGNLVFESGSQLTIDASSLGLSIPGLYTIATITGASLINHGVVVQKTGLAAAFIGPVSLDSDSIDMWIV